ncbi:MAG: Transporter [Rhodospirillales bacterium]|jgi:uncharacterized RDD family membrane protein YckC|nr:Transporter [Rhodospirillales bacterium]
MNEALAHSDATLTTDPRRELYYYVILDGESVGPLSAGEIAELATAGRVSSTTRAWHEELDHWIEIGRMPELMAVAPGLALADLPVSGPTFDAPLAPFGRRFAAGVIDTLLVYVIVTPLFLVVPPLNSIWEALLTDEAAVGDQLIFVATMTALSALYYIPPLWLANGQTIGYLALRLRLVDERTRSVPSPWQLLLWCAATSLLFVGWILYFFDARRRMLHNVLSRTVVVRATT